MEKILRYTPRRPLNFVLFSLRCAENICHCHCDVFVAVVVLWLPVTTVLSGHWECTGDDPTPSENNPSDNTFPLARIYIAVWL